MVYRPLPMMTADDSSNRRQSKLYKLLIIAGVLGAFIFGYYLFSYSSENQGLRRKLKKISYQLSKYASAYATCERNMKTAKSDIQNFLESNKQLQAANRKQEESLAELDKTNAQNSLKLDQAYQFFLDAKILLKDDNSISEDKSILPEASTTLKTEIESLKAEHVELENLKLKHTETSKVLNSLQINHDEVTSRSTELEKHVQELLSNSQKLKRENTRKKQKLEEHKSIIATLEQRIEKLENENEKLSNLKITAAKPQPPAVEVTVKSQNTVENESETKKEAVKTDSKSGESKPETKNEATEAKRETIVKLDETVPPPITSVSQPIEDKSVVSERRVVEEAHQMKMAPPTQPPVTTAAPVAIESQSNVERAPKQVSEESKEIKADEDELDSTEEKDLF